MRSPIRLAHDVAVAILTLAKPEARNARSLEVIEELISAFAAIEADDAVRVRDVDKVAHQARLETARASKPARVLPRRAKARAGQLPDRDQSPSVLASDLEHVPAA